MVQRFHFNIERIEGVIMAVLRINSTVTGP